MQHPTLHYGHWQPDEDHPVLGAQTRTLGQRNYLAEDYLAETRPHGTVKCVHVQAAIGSPDPVDETEWLQEAHDRTGAPNAIVGYVDLRHPAAEKEIERHRASCAFKGIRDFSSGDCLVADDFRRGFSLLGKYGLIASVAAKWQDMEHVVDLARANPATTIVLDHTGLPQERTDEYFQQWRGGMAVAAQADNVICKISGLGMADNPWTKERIRPYVESVIELFGSERALFATNWPIDSLWSDYATLVNAYREIAASLSATETEALFAGNTERIYRI